MVLLMKEMRLDNIQNFPFPTPPPRIALLNAEEVYFKKSVLIIDVKRLALLGALDPQSKGITDIGRKMSKLPVSPRCSKMYNNYFLQLTLAIGSFWEINMVAYHLLS